MNTSNVRPYLLQDNNNLPDFRATLPPANIALATLVERCQNPYRHISTPHRTCCRTDTFHISPTQTHHFARAVSFVRELIAIRQPVTVTAIAQLTLALAFVRASVWLHSMRVLCYPMLLLFAAWSSHPTSKTSVRPTANHSRTHTHKSISCTACAHPIKYIHPPRRFFLRWHLHIRQH